MKALIWIGTIVIGVALNELLGLAVGFKLGYVLLPVLLAAIARALTAKVDGGKKDNKKVEEKKPAAAVPAAPAAPAKPAAPAPKPVAPVKPVAPAPQARDTWVCRKCGYVHDKTVNFCDRCGTSKAASQPASPAVNPTAAPVIHTPAVQQPIPAAPVQPVAAQAPAPYLKLYVSSLNTDVTIERASFTVGRDSQSDLSLARLPNAQYIARRQASFTYSGGAWYIRDEGSTNGTFLNNRQLAAHSPFRLNAGDFISFAGKETLIVKQLTR